MLELLDIAGRNLFYHGGGVDVAFVPRDPCWTVRSMCFMKVATTAVGVEGALDVPVDEALVVEERHHQLHKYGWHRPSP